MHAQGFIRGKGKLVSIDYQASPEHGVQGYPFLLITGRLLEHYNVGTMTRRTPNRDLVAEDVLDIHPADAAEYKIVEDGRVKVQSRWGEITLKKQGEGKNIFDKTKSFSIEQTETNYTMEEYLEVLKIATDLTNKISFKELKEILNKNG